MTNHFYNYEERLISDNEVLRLFKNAFEKKSSLSLARCGHGEVSIALHAYTDWIIGWESRDYVGATGTPQRMQKDIRKAIVTADIVGLHMSSSPEEADKKSSKEAKKLLNLMNISLKNICNAWITHNFVYNEAFWSLICELSVVLIGRRSEEAKPFLEKKRVAVTGCYFLDGYSEIPNVCDRLCKDSEWQLALISAGVPATILAPRLAQASGRLTMDFGHALDKIIDGDKFSHDKSFEKFSRKRRCPK